MGTIKFQLAQKWMEEEGLTSRKHRQLLFKHSFDAATSNENFEKSVVLPEGDTNHDVPKDNAANCGDGKTQKTDLYGGIPK